jgi:hypothetical protein
VSENSPNLVTLVGGLSAGQCDQTFSEKLSPKMAHEEIAGRS